MNGLSVYPRLDKRDFADLFHYLTYLVKPIGFKREKALKSGKAG